MAALRAEPAQLTRRRFSCPTPAWRPGDGGRERPPGQGLAPTATARASMPG